MLCVCGVVCEVCVWNAALWCGVYLGEWMLHVVCFCVFVCSVWYVCLHSTEGMYGVAHAEEQQKEEVTPKHHCEQIFPEAPSTEAEAEAGRSS